MKETKRNFAKKVMFGFITLSLFITFSLAITAEDLNLTRAVPYLIYLNLALPSLLNNEIKGKRVFDLSICIFSAFMIMGNLMIGGRAEYYFAAIIWLIILLLYLE